MSVEAALKAAFEGPERKKLKVHGHEFNIKPMEVIREGGTTRAHGQISHHLSHRPDDQVHYDIAVANRQVTELRRRVDEGGWSKIWAAVAPFAAAASGVQELNSAQIKEAIAASERLLNGSWLGVVDYLLGLFATKLVAGYSLGQMSQALSGSPPEPAGGGGAGWSGWSALGAPQGGFHGAPAVVSRNGGVCNIYARGGDNALWQRAYWDGAWRGWERHDDGGVLASEPALGSMGPDHEHVFVRGADNQVWQKWWTGRDGWSGWIALGAPPGGSTGAPAVISRNNSVCNIYVRGADNALWQRAYWGGAWRGWERHEDGGVLASEPAPSSMGPEHEHVFVRGTDNQVWQKWWTG